MEKKKLLLGTAMVAMSAFSMGQQHAGAAATSDTGVTLASFFERKSLSPP